jgi:hypothetical protein
MSLAGLGLSLGQTAKASTEPAASRGSVMPFGLSGLHTGDGAAAAMTDDAIDIPLGDLDVTLTSRETAPAQSDEDRAAVALAMILMAEPPSTGSVAMPAEVDRRLPAKLDGETAEPGRSVETPGSSRDHADRAGATRLTARLAPRFDEGAPGEMLATSAPEPAVSAAPPQARAETVDLDLGAPAEVDINLASPASLDLNLDLGIALDLNLDLGTELDLRLDRPPVFPFSRLKPTDIAVTGRTAPAAPPADTLSRTAAEHAEGQVQTAAAEVGADVKFQGATGDASAAPELKLAPPEVAAAAPARASPEIVVATHPERVLRSLEALLANDDPARARFGAKADEVFVSSHAEKALLMLAECARGDGRYEDFAAPPAPAQDPGVQSAARGATPVRRSALGDSAVAVNEHHLDRVRGGFQTSNGLTISFGIERAVYINGSLVTTTNLNVSDAGKVSSTPGSVTSAAAGSSNLTLIQNGSGNTFISGPVSPATVGTVVQNTLNDQKIQSVTAINASVNSLQLVRAQNFQSTLRGAVIDSLRR